MNWRLLSLNLTDLILMAAVAFKSVLAHFSLPLQLMFDHNNILQKQIIWWSPHNNLIDGDLYWSSLKRGLLKISKYRGCGNYLLIFAQRWFQNVWEWSITWHHGCVCVFIRTLRNQISPSVFLFVWMID